MFTTKDINEYWVCKDSRGKVWLSPFKPRVSEGEWVTPHPLRAIDITSIFCGDLGDVWQESLHQIVDGVLVKFGFKGEPFFPDNEYKINIRVWECPACREKKFEVGFDGKYEAWVRCVACGCTECMAA
jgi:hypothetical protein